MNVRAHRPSCTAKPRLSPTRGFRALTCLAGIILLATSAPLVSQAAVASGLALNAQQYRASAPPPSTAIDVAMQGTARCDDAIQLPDGWTCHRGRSYRLHGLRLAFRETKASQVVQ